MSELTREQALEVLADYWDQNPDGTGGTPTESDLLETAHQVLRHTPAGFSDEITEAARVLVRE